MANYDYTPTSTPKIIIQLSEGESPVDELLARVLLEAVALFRSKARDYATRQLFTADFLGAKGQFAEIWRKIPKLHKGMWLDEELQGEQVDEILMDFFGHILLALSYYREEQPKGTDAKNPPWATAIPFGYGLGRIGSPYLPTEPGGSLGMPNLPRQGYGSGLGAPGGAGNAQGLHGEGGHGGQSVSWVLPEGVTIGTTRPNPVGPETPEVPNLLEDIDFVPEDMVVDPIENKNDIAWLNTLHHNMYAPNCVFMHMKSTPDGPVPDFIVGNICIACKKWRAQEVGPNFGATEETR